MRAEIIDVTPAMASQFLKRNTKNRKISQERVRQYAKEMKEGRWQLTHQGVCFYEDGTLADGQHRLEGICLANVAVPMMVVYDLPNGTSMIDRGRNRNLSNILALEGLPEKLTRIEVTSCVNFMFRLVNASRLPADMLLADFILNNHGILSQIRNVVDAGKSGHKNNSKRLAAKACCYAAAFCAMYNGISPTVLTRFFTVVNSGFSDGDYESAAIVFRNALLGAEDKRISNTSSLGKELFIQCTKAINDFVNYKSRRKVYDPTGPLYWEPVRTVIETKYIKPRRDP